MAISGILGLKSKMAAKFDTTLNLLSQNEDFDGFCLLSYSTTSSSIRLCTLPYKEAGWQALSLLSQGIYKKVLSGWGEMLQTR